MMGCGRGYGEYEMLAFNLIKKGMLGEIVQAEVGYTHDQRNLQYNPGDGVFWRIKRHQTHHGNYYPTHGLVPAGKCLDINRGDKFDYLVSPACPPEPWRRWKLQRQGRFFPRWLRDAHAADGRRDFWGQNLAF